MKPRGIAAGLHSFWRSESPFGVLRARTWREGGVHPPCSLATTARYFAASLIVILLMPPSRRLPPSLLPASLLPASVLPASFLTSGESGCGFASSTEFLSLRL